MPYHNGRSHPRLAKVAQIAGCGKRVARRSCYRVLLAAVLLSGGCTDVAWNNPYPRVQAEANTLYSSFEERPKHLDPARAYSSNEYAFIAQIYEPPLQYHYLKRPYTLAPLAARELPEVSYFDASGQRLTADAPVGQIAWSEYEVRLRPGMRYQPHPALATDAQGNYRFLSLPPDGLEDIYRLADFPAQGTREVVADDYVYQIKRLADPHSHSPIAGVMQEYIVGFDELRNELTAAREAAGDGYLDLREFQLTGVEVVDATTYRIRIQGKYPQFLYWLAMPFFAPMPWEADRFYSQPGMISRNITLHWYPVGSGPYMLAENNPNLRMVLLRNPEFHGERYPDSGMPGDAAAGLLHDAGRELPLIDKAVYNLEKETIPYWSKFLQGYYDSSGISSDSFDQAVQFTAEGDLSLTPDMQDHGISLVTAVTTSVYYTGFNMHDAVVGGSSERARKLRQAIAIAVDYEEFISIFTNGRGIVAQSPLPPGIFGHLDGAEGIDTQVYRWQNGTARRRPIADALRLLAEAGYTGGVDNETGKPLVLYFDTPATGPDAKARLNWMRKQFDKLGIQLVVRATDYNRFQDKMLKGTAQIYQWGWNADYPDPENFLFLLYGPNAKVKGGENASNYENPEFDRLFVRMKNMENGPARQAIIDAMLVILRQDAPWLWGYHPKSFSLYHQWYYNVTPNLMANNTLKYKRLDPVTRAEKRAQWNKPVIWPLLAVFVLLAAVIIPAVIVVRRQARSAAL